MWIGSRLRAVSPLTPCWSRLVHYWRNPRVKCLHRHIERGSRSAHLPDVPFFAPFYRASQAAFALCCADVPCAVPFLSLRFAPLQRHSTNRTPSALRFATGSRLGATGGAARAGRPGFVACLAFTPSLRDVSSGIACGDTLGRPALRAGTRLGSRAGRPQLLRFASHLRLRLRPTRVPARCSGRGAAPPQSRPRA